jgi:predicted nucleotidyltransferase
MLDFHLIKKCIVESPDIVVTYLFGSSIGSEQTVNDLDILVFLSEGAKRLETQFVLMNRLSKVAGFKPDRIDGAGWPIDSLFAP